MVDEFAVPSSVTARALRVLGAFEKSSPLLTLSAISRRTGLPVATCHRLIAELVEWGALTRDAEGKYSIGQRLWTLGLLAQTQQTLIETASPFMQDVLFVTQNVVNLFVREGSTALLVERISGTAMGAPLARVGDSLGLHSSAAGKVLLAYAPDDVVEEALRAPVKHTAHTVTDAVRIRKEMELVHRSGYAVTIEEAGYGRSGVAVPIMLPDSRVVAALGVVIVGRPPVLGSTVPVLRIAARGIARQLYLTQY